MASKEVRHIPKVPGYIYMHLYLLHHHHQQDHAAPSTTDRSARVPCFTKHLITATSTTTMALIIRAHGVSYVRTCMPRCTR
jgi:hypothetical protein